MPLIRRLPKRGFNNAAFHKTYAIVNLEDLNRFKAGTVVNEEALRNVDLVRGHVAGLKILGGGELKHGLTIEADKVSASAREKIEKAGGTITLREGRKPQTARVPEAEKEVVAAEGTAAGKPVAKKKPAAKTKAASKKKTSRKR